MPGKGFVQDELDLKVLILYIAARVIEPVPFDTILDLTLCDDAIDYFDFSECLRDLVGTGHLTSRRKGCTPLRKRGAQQQNLREQSGLFRAAALRQKFGGLEPEAAPEKPGKGSL